MDYGADAAAAVGAAVIAALAAAATAAAAADAVALAAVAADGQSAAMGHLLHCGLRGVHTSWPAVRGERGVSAVGRGGG